MEHNAHKIAADLSSRGLIAPANKNIEMIRMEGVRIVYGSMPRSVRSELLRGVKEGRLGHLKKQGLKPECYFHPNSEAQAKYLTRKEEEKIRNSSKCACVGFKEIKESIGDNISIELVD